MKRVSVHSNQSHGVDEEARVKFKHQTLLQDYLELQKEFVLKKKKLQKMKQKREILSTEIGFLQQRHKHLLKLQNPTGELIKHRDLEVQKKILAKEKNFDIEEIVLKNPSRLSDPRPIPDCVEEGGLRRQKDVLEPLRVDKKSKYWFNNEKSVGKKKIPWQDPVTLKV